MLGPTTEEYMAAQHEDGFIKIGEDGKVSIYDITTYITQPRKDLLPVCAYVRNIDARMATKSNNEILDYYDIKDDTTRVHPNIAFGIVMFMGPHLHPQIFKRMFKRAPVPKSIGASMRLGIDIEVSTRQNLDTGVVSDGAM